MSFRLGLAVGAVAAALGALPAPAAAGVNPQIAGLQVALRAHGLYFGPIDGISGAGTVGAVREFQRRHHLPVDGRADATTRKALGALGGPLFGRRVLTRGMFGWDVAVLQFLLTRRGFDPGVIEGYFDSRTERALRRYQRSVHVAMDGIAGSRTLAALGLGSRVPMAPRSTKLARYRVRNGDTLTAIARRYKISIRKLASLNKLDPNRVILVGARLQVPVHPAPTPHTAVVTNPYEVRVSLDRWAGHYGVDPHLTRALAWMESGYQNSVVSSVGAQGVMQLLPVTWSYVENILLGEKVPHTVDGNVRIGVAYLHHLLGEFGGNEKLALAAWYQGARAVRTRGLFGETKTFVADVLALKQRM
ncbi:MAG TPA: peptidoglycan-binding protein [Gaiellaceae bacterium]|jgi:soluble lytic murein transglycosylase-like protein